MGRAAAGVWLAREEIRVEAQRPLGPLSSHRLHYSASMFVKAASVIIYGCINEQSLFSLSPARFETRAALLNPQA